MTGIYEIKCKIDGKTYIGQAVDISKRIRKHLNNLRNGRHWNLHLQRAFTKYGENNFEFNVLCECERENLNDNEKLFISKFNSSDERYGFNKNDGGEQILRDYSGSNNPFYGKRHSQEFRERLSKINKGNEKIINASKGRKFMNNGEKTIKVIPEEFDKYLNLGYKFGRIVTWEPWNKGLHGDERVVKTLESVRSRITVESYKKISEKLTGRITSEEIKEKIRRTMKSKKYWWSELSKNDPKYVEWRRKLGKSIAESKRRKKQLKISNEEE